MKTQAEWIKAYEAMTDEETNAIIPGLLNQVASKPQGMNRYNYDYMAANIEKLRCRKDLSPEDRKELRRRTGALAWQLHPMSQEEMDFLKGAREAHQTAIVSYLKNEQTLDAIQLTLDLFE